MLKVGSFKASKSCASRSNPKVLKKEGSVKKIKTKRRVQKRDFCLRKCFN